MIYGIALIVLGILASPSLLLSKKPDAKELLDKITPYQGWIGLCFCIWGVLGVIQALLNLGWLETVPIWWITWLSSSVMESVLGFILGYGMISKYLLGSNEEAKKKGEELLSKLAPIQGKLGLAGVAVGAWVIVANIAFY
jgi:hypothetical protein